MVRSLALLIAVALATLVSACCPEDPFYPTLSVDTSIKNPAYLRVVHAAADAPAAGAVLGGKPFRPALGYLDFQAGINDARYYPADTSWHTIGFLGGGSMLATAPIAMEAGAHYTAYLHGRSPAYRILVTRDTVQAPAAVDQLKVRVVNLAPDAPAVDITFSTSPNDPVVRGLAYGSASSYSIRGAAELNEKPGILVSESGTGDTLLAYPAGITSLFGKATMTLVVSGMARPSGEEPMLSFAAFVESYVDPETGLYGLAPFRLNLTAIRLINIVTTKPTESLDLSFYDRDFEVKFPGENQGFRRYFAGQGPVKKVPSLVYAAHQPQGYFLQSWSEAKSVWPYRVERSTEPYWNNLTQTPITAVDTLRTELNKRATVVVFGPDTNLVARTVELNDNVVIASLAQSRLRFFHGAHGSLQGTQLRLRVGGIQGPLQSYGQPTTKEMAIEVSTGAVTLEVVDASGTVIASTQATLEGGVAYTVFFAPLADGSGWIIRPVADLVQR